MVSSKSKSRIVANSQKGYNKISLNNHSRIFETKVYIKRLREEEIFHIFLSSFIRDMSLCSEMSLHSLPLWNRGYSVLNDDDQDSVLLFPELLFSPLNKSLVINTLDSSDVVSVGEYKVKASLSSTLQSIFDKYGDITADSKLQSLSTRTYHLETLAEIVIELQSTPLNQLSETRASEILEIVKDIETAKIRVAWLRSVLEEVSEATRFVERRDMVVMEKKACEQGLLLAKQEMELSLKELEEKEKEIKQFRERLMKTTGKLGSLEMKRTSLDKRFVFLKSKVEKFQGQSVLKDIL